MSLLGLIILIIVLAACAAVVHVVFRQFGTAVPSWAVSILWIIVVAVVAIFAIRFLFSL